MKRLNVVQRLMFFVVLLSLLLGCGDKKFTLQENQDTFTVTLASNPTTGYQWTLENYDKNIFRLKGHKYAVSHPELIGSGGDIVFTFAIVKAERYPDSSIITFKHSRRWEPQSASYKHVKVYIEARQSY